MGSNGSKIFPSITDYNSLNEDIEATVTKEDLYLEKLTPRPPRKRKSEIYDPTKYKKLNEHIDNTPANLLNTDVKGLVKYLTKSCTDDLAKVHALFYWVTSRSLFGAPGGEKSKKYSATWYLNDIFNGDGNFAHFFYVLCWHADIPCVIIGGITKNSAYKIGLPVVNAEMAAQWNAVYVEDDWHLTNIQWACICANEPNDWKRVVVVTEKEFSSKPNRSTDHDKHCNDLSIPQKPRTNDEYFHRINDFYFLTDPDEFIWTHFPNKKKWQLLDEPVSLEEFLCHFYVREQFYLLDMSVTDKSHTDCVLLVDEYNEVRIEFDLPPSRTSTYRFKYTLAHHWSSRLPDKRQSLLQQGKYEVKDDRFSLTLQFTSDGTYKLDIFGSEQENCDFYLICSYVVKCSYTEEGPSLPWKFFLGYGAGVKPQEKTVKTKDGRIKLTFPIERGATIVHVLKSHEGRILDGCSLLRMADDDVDNPLVTMIIELRLPEPGKYSLKVYDKRNAESCNHLCHYCIIYERDEETLPMLEGSSTAKDSWASQRNRIAVLSHPGSFIHTNLDDLKIVFRSEYQLSCKLLSHDASTRDTTKTSVLHDMVTKECQFKVNISTCGDYTLKIFAKFGEEAKGGGQVYEFHSYRIRKVNSDHFPTRGLLGTNQNTSSAHIARTFETHQSVINIIQVEITNETLLVLQYQKAASLCSNLVKVYDVEDESNIQVTLPQIGDYLLSMLKTDTATGLVRNVTRYLLRRKQDTDKDDSNNNLQQQTSQEENKVTIRETTMVKKSQIPIKTSEPGKKTEMEKTVEQADLQKKTIEFSENKNIESNQPKSSSKSIVNNQAAVEVDVDVDVDVEKSVTRSVKSDTMIDPVRKKVGSENTTPKKNNKETGKQLKSDIMDRAEELLDVLQAKKDLVQAYDSREKELLASALEEALKVNFNNELDEEISVAQELYKRLCDLDKVRSEIGCFNSRAVSEIKSYSNPPQDVIVIMKSVFLILNEPETEVKDWKQIRTLMRSIQKPFLRRIMNCNPRGVSSESVKGAEINLGTLRAEDISSEMAKALFNWVKHMIAEAKNKELNIDLRLLKK